MSAAADAKAPPRDHVRETLETLVFVVVLVLILQLFVLEAFVIPTGSMAETQLGYHKNVVCQQCQYGFPVNCSDEVERPSRDTYVYGYKCPNCQNVGMVDWNDRVSPTSGDRVLVHKAMSADAYPSPAWRAVLCASSHSERQSSSRCTIRSTLGANHA